MAARRALNAADCAQTGSRGITAYCGVLRPVQPGTGAVSARSVAGSVEWFYVRGNPRPRVAALAATSRRACFPVPPGKLRGRAHSSRRADVPRMHLRQDGPRGEVPAVGWSFSARPSSEPRWRLSAYVALW
jgi:hypothetical protein